jgi:RNA polymerase sigma-70 factor (ECF subfamily)
LQAGQEETAAARGALESLCKSYRYPLYVHARRRGRSHQDAEDSTHQFLVRLIERKLVQHANPGRGRFRSFLLTSFKNFLADEWDKLNAEKRGGGQKLISWDDVNPEERYALEPCDSLTPDQIYEKRWAATLLDRVMKRLEMDRSSERQRREFDLLRNHVWGTGPALRHDEVAAQLGIKEDSVKTAVFRLRDEFRKRLREEVRQTMESPNPSPQELDEELRYLQSVLNS